MTQVFCAREGGEARSLNRRAGARLERSLYSRLKNLDLSHWQQENTEDSISSWAQKEGSVVGQAEWEGNGNEAGTDSQSQRQWGQRSRVREWTRGDWLLIGLSSAIAFPFKLGQGPTL